MTRKEKIIAVAAACHAANRAFCLGVGDSSQKPWEEAEEWQRESAVNGVEFALTNGEPGAQHEKWRADKVAAGWTWGPVKDGEKKTHPSLVPFVELSATERLKDEIFISTARSVAAVLDLS